ncbi:MAG TPA: YbhB/YbcL family Raf kinase inhibitor-like protein [Mycobacterium sp.]|nr:YbhB/YbcL family Raf kinase inhibitor-like protein [Mycobacterium sp.]
MQDAAAMRPAVVLAATALFALAGCGRGTNVVSAEFSLTSPAFAENSQIPPEYSCDVGNAPPPLHWQNVPTDAESLAVVVDDPDAPHGRYVHWVVTGIPPSSTEIVGGGLPAGAVVSLNSSGKADYLGPCPPPGASAHHYRFQLYALRKPLTLAPGTPVEESTTTIANLSVAVARTVGLFRR